MTMKLAIAQINCVLGDLAGNAAKILHYAGQAGKRHNGASRPRDGKVVATYLKHDLPNYAVFDEKRYFDHGSEPCVFELEGVRFALNICADIWEPAAARQPRDAGAQVLLVLNASP